MKAIILAAGQGSRLMPLTKEMPKSMLKVGGKPILKWIVGNLKSCGIHEIIIVTGYKQDKIQEFFGDTVQYRYNPFFKHCNQVGSAWFARNDMNDEFVYIHADVFFDVRILEDLLKRTEDICIAVEPREDFEEEDHKVIVAGDHVREVHKETIPHEAAFGEFLGMVRFSKKGAGFIKSEIERIVQIEGNLDKYFSFSINRLINKGVEVHHCDISYPWIEIDFPEEMDIAEKILANMQLANY